MPPGDFVRSSRGLLSFWLEPPALGFSSCFSCWRAWTGQAMGVLPRVWCLCPRPSSAFPFWSPGFVDDFLRPLTFCRHCPVAPRALLVLSRGLPPFVLPFISSSPAARVPGVSAGSSRFRPSPWFPPVPRFLRFSARCPLAPRSICCVFVLFWLRLLLCRGSPPPSLMLISLLHYWRGALARLPSGRYFVCRWGMSFASWWLRSFAPCALFSALTSWSSGVTSLAGALPSPRLPSPTCCHVPASLYHLWGPSCAFPSGWFLSLSGLPVLAPCPRCGCPSDSLFRFSGLWPAGAVLSSPRALRSISPSFRAVAAPPLVAAVPGTLAVAGF